MDARFYKIYDLMVNGRPMHRRYFSEYESVVNVRPLDRGNSKIYVLV